MRTTCATKILEGLELKLYCLEIFDILNFQELQMILASMVNNMLTNFMNDDIICGWEKLIVLKLKYITPNNLESYKWLLIWTSLQIHHINRCNPGLFKLYYAVFVTNLNHK